MTYITEELKESFKDYLAEQSYIYDDNKQGLTHSYYWDYRDIIEPWLMKKLIEDYGDYPTVKDALHQYALENDIYITTPTKKQIIIQKNDKRHLVDLLDNNETKYFLKEMAAHETECTLEEDWLIEDDLASRTHQINYYRSLKTDQERQIYATAIGQQYALDLLCSSLEEITRLYDLDFLNTFFKTVEFKLA